MQTIQETEEILAVVLSIRYRAEDEKVFTVAMSEAEIDGMRVEFAIVGQDPRRIIDVGLEVKLRGRWVEDERFGTQFKFSQVATAQPTSRISVIAYLDRFAPGVGKAIAGRLFDAFGSDCVKTLRTDPELASETLGRFLSLRVAREAAEELEKLANFEEALIELVHLFDGRGFSRSLPERLVDDYGIEAPDIVRRNPFFLMLNRLPGCGFKRCDLLYLDLGKNPAALKRQLLSLIHRIESDMSGNTWFRSEWLSDRLREDISSIEADPQRVFELGIRSHWLSKFIDEDGRTWITTRERAEDEARLARRVEFLADFVETYPAEWPNLDGSALSAHQLDRYNEIAKRRVSILSGTPGTGKTFAAVQVIKGLIEQGYLGKIAIAAPTGKAGVRLRTVLESYGVSSIFPKTIHRLLVPLRNGHDRKGWGFRHGADNPLPHKFFFIDESSMIDVSLARSLFEAIPFGAHVMLIGDPYQLPPVGHGAPFRDIINSGRIGFGELDEVRRNSGDIVRVCRELKDGKRYKPSRKFDEVDGGNLRHFETGTSKETAETLVKLLKNLPDRFDPVWDVQVIVALNESGDLNRKKLNRGLQGILNPHGSIPGDVEGDYPLRLGDKVICLSNKHHELLNDDGSEIEPPEDFEEDEKKPQKVKDLVANGEIGRVVKVEKSFADVMIQTPKRRVRIPRFKEGDLDPCFKDWSLAYAVTCHKMQGSSSPIVIALIDEAGGARFICRREWFYTAISRAEIATITIGSKAILESNSQETALEKRKTFLKEMIQDEEL